MLKLSTFVIIGPMAEIFLITFWELIVVKFEGMQCEKGKQLTTYKLNFESVLQFMGIIY